MKYLGGKHGIGKLIAEFISTACPSNKVNGYLEPFCGSLGVFKNMTDKHYKKYVASDKQPDLIELWRKIQANKLRLPEHISEEEYNKLKHANSPNAMKAVAGFALSFGGKYFAGYSQKWAGNSGRDFLKEFKTSLEKIKPTIQQKNVHFYNRSYNEFHPHNILIYCDPPYKSTEGYSSTGTFDHEEFWNTMRKWSKDNCVFISEENAPSDFKVVWKKSKRRTLDKTSRFYKYEKIYSYKGKYSSNKTLKNYTSRRIKTRKNKNEKK
jgi:DNA adenine methylase